MADEIVAPITQPVSKFESVPEDLIPDKWKDHFADLRRENKTLRERTHEMEKTHKTAFDDAIAKASSESEAKLTAAQQASNDRILRAELKAAALKAGMIDLDGLKLADLSLVKMNDAGDVEGAEALMEKMKETKPYLFGVTSTTTQTTAAPTKKQDAPADARKLNKDEYEAQKRALTAHK